MKRYFLLTAMLGFILCFAQRNELFNPKGKWYFGAELGSNNITSDELNLFKNSVQGGLLAEYYFAKHWSISGKIKYFKTGVSFYNPDTHSGGWFDLGSDESYGTFKGQVIAIPIYLKWEFRIFKNFSNNLKLGVAYNYETKSYYNFSPNMQSNHPRQFFSINPGYGFNYLFNDNLAIYIDLESQLFGGYKGSNDEFLWNKPYYTSNNLISLGIKYNFK